MSVFVLCVRVIALVRMLCCTHGRLQADQRRAGRAPGLHDDNNDNSNNNKTNHDNVNNRYYEYM